VVLQECCTWRTKGSKRVSSSGNRDEPCVRSRRSAGAAGRAEHNLVLTPRLPAAVAIFDVIAGCDPADPVIAASQGKWAGSYLRFLDKDGAHGARLGVVHQLFTSEDADPGAMARALARNVSGSRRQGRAAAVGSVKGRSPAPTGTGKMRRRTKPLPR
jgi:hypothetical protein